MTGERLVTCPAHVLIATLKSLSVSFDVSYKRPRSIGFFVIVIKYLANSIDKRKVIDLVLNSSIQVLVEASVLPYISQSIDNDKTHKYIMYLETS